MVFLFHPLSLHNHLKFTSVFRHSHFETPFLFPRCSEISNLRLILLALHELVFVPEIL